MTAFLVGPKMGESAEIARDNSRRELIYSVFEAASMSEATALVVADAPEVYDLLPLTSISAGHLGAGAWEYRVSYTPYAMSDTKRIRLSTAGGRATKTHSFTTVAKFLSDDAIAASITEASLPDFKNAINVENGEIKGVEIIVPAFRLTLSKEIDPVTLPTDFCLKNYLLTGTTNDIPVVFLYRGQWFSFDTQEMLLESFDADIPNEAKGSFSWTIQCEPSIVNQRLGTVPGVTKKGFDYAWPFTEPVTSGNTMSRRITALYIESVNPTALARGVSWTDIGGF